MKKLTFILALIMCALLIVSCSNNDIPTDDTTTADQVDTTAPIETAAPPLSIVSDGTTEYKVIRPDSDESLTSISVDLRVALENAYGIKKMGISTDFERNVDPADRYPYEILVGLTNREESIQAFNSIKYNDFIIKKGVMTYDG